MQTLPAEPLRTLDDVAHYEAEMPLAQRLPGRSVFDVFTATAQRHPKATALTMVMTGADDEQPRRVNYTELLSLTEDELRQHAEKTIAERPAWPRFIYFVDAIPLTTVGKIYKPQLRCDAAQRLVTQIVCGQMKLSDAAIKVREGGRRGMTVSVRLPEGQHAAGGAGAAGPEPVLV